MKLEMSDEVFNSPYAKLFIIPQKKDDREFLLAVDRRTRDVLDNKYGILLSYDWQANTITDIVLETMISLLAFTLKSKSIDGIGCDFYNIIRATVSIKTNDKAEKEGNINIYFEPGDKVKDIIANPENIASDKKVVPMEEFTTGDADEDAWNTRLEEQARYNLSTNYGILFRDYMKFHIFAITTTFIESIYKEILYRLSNMKEDDSYEQLVSVNFNDLIEIHGVMKDGMVNIIMRPGVQAKLLIKCDELTEHTMGDMDD